MEIVNNPRSCKTSIGEQIKSPKTVRIRPSAKDIIFILILCVAILVILTFLINLGESSSTTGIFRPFLTDDPMLLKCTVTIVSGKFWTQSADSNVWQEGTSGMVLAAGTMIKTDVESKVLLTFFEGSTLGLEPGTEIKIEQLRKATEGYHTILLQQVLGRTWSLVEKMTDIRSRYEIHTPSAVALVRGTCFTVSVNDTGTTYIGVVEGLVDVEAQGEKVSVPAGYKLNVYEGMHQSSPVQMDPGEMQEFQKSIREYRNSSKLQCDDKDLLNVMTNILNIQKP